MNWGTFPKRLKLLGKMRMAEVLKIEDLPRFTFILVFFFHNILFIIG